MGVERSDAAAHDIGLVQLAGSMLGDSTVTVRVADHLSEGREGAWPVVWLNKPASPASIQEIRNSTHIRGEHRYTSRHCFDDNPGGCLGVRQQYERIRGSVDVPDTG